jgi:hypothetical protein
MKRIYAAVILLLLFFLQACHGLSYSRITTKVNKINIEGDIDWRTIQTIESALGVLPPAIIQSIQFISFHGNPDHFQSAVGHTNGSTICFNSNLRITKGYVCHEAAHSYTNVLGARWINQWNAAAGGVYEQKWDNYRNPNIIILKNGILRSYGLQNALEDIAVWTEEIYKYCEYSEDSVFSRMLDYQYDPRFLKKLNLLLKWGFITEKEYQKIQPLLK